MKIRNLLAVVAMLSVFIIGIGTAHAVISVNDAVPGQDVIIPIICEGEAHPPAGAATFGTLDTLWAIADKTGGTHFPDSAFVVCADVWVFNSRSEEIFDTDYCWTAFDVVADSCSALIAQMGATDQLDMQITTSNGRKYFAGYVVVAQVANAVNPLGNKFVPWVYLTDLPKGFASGMNGISAENGTGLFTQLGEDGGNAAVAAESIYPRMFIMNDRPDSWNWWILLLGRNAYTQLTLPSFDRELTCFICDEEEECNSQNISIPDELNIINVRDYVSGVVLPGCFGQTGCPIAGFARCTISETGETLTGLQVSISGTTNFPTLSPNDTPWYSLYGWSYQRAAESTATLSWDVIQEIHRVYCSAAIQGNNPADNGGDCSFTVN